MSVIYFKPREVITLYDYKNNPSLEGTLMLGVKIVEPVDWLSLVDGEKILDNSGKVLESFFPTLILESKKVGRMYQTLFSQTARYLSDKKKYLSKLIYQDFENFTASFYHKIDNSSFLTKVNLSRPKISISAIPLNIPKLKITSYLRKLTLVCLVASLIGLLSISLPILVNEVHSVWYLHSTQGNNLDQKINTRLQEVYQKPLTPKSVVDINDFRLIIPKIGLNSSVVPEVDPANEKLYGEALKKGVAQAKGSYLPGETGGPTFLFSHSTDSITDIAQFNAKFFFLKDLKIGDDIYIYFEGNKYRYRITDRQIINPDDLGVVQNSKANLILSTCYPPGTDWQRLVLSAILLPV